MKRGQILPFQNWDKNQLSFIEFYTLLIQPPKTVKSISKMRCPEQKFKNVY